jgi:hypothetical protein
MKLEDLTIGELRQFQQVLLPNKTTDDCHWKVGSNYFIRTVTHHLTGKLIKVTDKELVMVDAAWIADDGRYTEAIKSCEFSEVEIYPDNQEIIVGRGAIIDATTIPNLPRNQK